MKLPRHVVVPDLSALVHDTYLRHVMDQPLAALRALPDVTIEIDSALALECWSAYPLRIDGVEVVFDIADDCVLSARASCHKHWMKRQYLSCFESYPNLGSLPQVSFPDWEQFEWLRKQVSYAPNARKSILHAQYFGDERGPRGPGPRRRQARALLWSRFRHQVDGRLTRQEEFWMRVNECAVSVHIGGSYVNSLDRGQWQMMALGCCTVSPTLFTYCGDMPPIAGEHYLRCRDDLDDLCDVVERCLRSPTLCEEVGKKAARFFAERGTPAAMWARITERTTSA